MTDQLLPLVRDNPRMRPRDLRKRLRVENRRAFTREFGATAGKLLIDAKLELAKQMLLRDEFCQFVAKRVGFSDRTAFHHWFVRHVGETPRRWKVARLKER